MANKKYKLGFGAESNIQSAIENGILDGGDLIITKDTQRLAFVRMDDNSVMFVKSNLNTFDDVDSASNYALNNTSAYAGELISVKVGDKYKTYRLQPAESGFTIEDTDISSSIKQYVKIVDDFPESDQEEGIIYIADTVGKVWNGSEWKTVFDEVSLKSYIDGLFQNIVTFAPGVVSGETPLPSTDYKAGQTWRVIDTGVYAGQNCEPGDLIICVANYTESYSDEDFIVVQSNISGAVTSSIDSSKDNDLVVFDGVSGKVIKSSGISAIGLKEMLDWFSDEQTGLPKLKSDVTELQTIVKGRKYEPYVLSNCVFACGVPITISAGENDTNIITWYSHPEKKKTLTIPSGTDIYGGCENSNSDVEVLYPSTSIVMNSGKVNCIFGGGSGLCNVGTSTVIVNGGSVAYVSGAGATNLKKNNHVGHTHVIINNVDEEIAGVYGSSGEGYATTTESLIEMNGGSANYVTLGGSNGYTSLGKIIVNDGHIKTLQGGNRGTMSDVEYTIKGGTIDKMFAWGEGENKDPSDDPVFKNSKVNIYGGTIHMLKPGYNGSSTSGATVKGEYISGVIDNEEEALNDMPLLKKATTNEGVMEYVDSLLTITEF